MISWVELNENEKKECFDGKDDGNITIVDKATSMAKGAYKSLKGLFFDGKGNFSLKRTAMTVDATAATATAAFVSRLVISVIAGAAGIYGIAKMQ